MSGGQTPSAQPATQTPAVDWNKQRTEILRQYRSLVQIDTSNPPGNETKAAEYLKKIFDAEGIPAKIFALDPARGNLVARLKGSGKKRPILLMAHTDVVGVQREKWPVDPFGAVLKDGYVWGRGTSDDKDKLAQNRALKPKVRRAGSDKWEDISWNDALDRMARHMKDSRDKKLVLKDKDGLEVNRNEGFGFVGGATITSEEGYLTAKFFRALGCIYLEQQARV